jgi:hypothetical protein
MKVVVLSSLIIALCSVIIMSQGCLDKGTEPPPDSLTVSRGTLAIVPGTSTTITVSGGAPPYSVTIDPPLPVVVTAVFADSSQSGTTLTISVLASATIGDGVTVIISDTKTSAGIPISVSFVAVGNVSYSDDVQPIWDASCQPSCHEAGGSAPFSLNRFVSYNNLYFFVVSNTNCGAVFRVVPGSLDSSLVWLMIKGLSPTCPRMPLSPIPGDTLNVADQNKIRDWILQGAENN